MWPRHGLIRFTDLSERRPLGLTPVYPIVFEFALIVIRLHIATYVYLLIMQGVHHPIFR